MALISRYKGFTRSFDAALFGNILAVGQSDVVAVVAVTFLTVAVMFVGYKYFLFLTFEPEVASSMVFPPAG